MGVSECLCEGKNTECDCQWVNLLMGSILCVCVWGCVRWKDEPERSVCVCVIFCGRMWKTKVTCKKPYFSVCLKKDEVDQWKHCRQDKFRPIVFEKRTFNVLHSTFGLFCGWHQTKKVFARKTFPYFTQKTRFLFFSTKHFVNFSPTIWTVLIERKKVFLISDLL